MDDDKEIRKRRRRSVRNLRRQSGVLPLNLNALDEGTEVGSEEVSQSDGNQHVYGSMWWESQEPVAKKRRRRSSLLVGLAPRTMKPAIEDNEEWDDGNNCNVNITKIPEEQSDMQSLVERNGNNDRDTFIRSELQIMQTDASDVVSYSQVKDSQNNFSGSGRCSENTALVNTENVKGVETSVPNVENNFFSPELVEFNNSVEGRVNGNTSLNLSDISIKSPGNCDMSKDSPASMSPDFPMSPNTAIYHDHRDDSYVRLNNSSNGMTGSRHLEKLESAQSDDTLANSICEMIQKSPGADQVSDLSHSDKENSIINENDKLDVTPQLKDESAEKVSPGFMSLCKAFAGKVVNFVRTSPSFLTGSVTSVTDSASASPPLKGSTSQNIVSNELSTFGEQSDINKSLDKFSIESFYLESADNNKEASSVCDGKSKEIENKNCDRQVEKSENISKSRNSAIFGSAKKQRDRKTFFDTFNAVSVELNKERRQSSCTDDAKEKMNDKTGCQDFKQHKEQNIEQSTDGLNEVFVKSKSDIPLEHKAPTDSPLSDNAINENITNNNQCTNLSDNDICANDVAKNENISSVTPVNFKKNMKEEYTEQLEADMEEPESTNDGVSINTDCTELKNDTFSFDGKCVDKLFRNVTKFVDMEIDCTITNILDVNSSGVSDDTEQRKEKILAEEAKTENIEIEHAEDKTESTNRLCFNDKSNVKRIAKKQERKALDITNAGDSKTCFVSTVGKGVKVAECDDANEKNKSLGLDMQMEDQPAEMKQNKQRFVHQAKSSVLTDSCEAVGTIQIRDKLKIERNNVQKGEENKRTTKMRKNRRKSFGVQHVQCMFVNDKDVSNTAMRNARTQSIGSEIGTEIRSETKVTKTVDVDGSHIFSEEELHLEKRVAELDLGLESSQTESEQGKVSSKMGTQVFQDIQPSEKISLQNIFPTNSFVDKRKRGRPRKSAVFKEVIKKGRPRKGSAEQVLEVDEHVNTDERQNVTELTNEISQVQISGANTELPSLETAISVESLILPGDDKTVYEQVNEPKRKRRRSAEVASLKLHMIDFDESPSSKNIQQDKRKRRKSADSATLKIQLGLDDQDKTDVIEHCSPNEEGVVVNKVGRKRKFKEESFDELEKIYRNKNFVKPEEKKPWQTVLESPSNPVESFGKKRLHRHIDFERPTQMKLRRRLQRAVKNGWDPKKRKRSELNDDYVQEKLANIWSELDQSEEGPDSLQSRLRSIVETT